ncbi:hypothetical protein IWX50DRAFT_699223 [Phyllosticta citricarpa]|uniref:Uncharacterized protein n=1 Tax=Phyllosticta citricarpa TaxID=55181 RepID=A0ABR1MEZ3_9PEZI
MDVAYLPLEREKDEFQAPRAEVSCSRFSCPVIVLGLLVTTWEADPTGEVEPCLSAPIGSEDRVIAAHDAVLGYILVVQLAPHYLHLLSQLLPFYSINHSNPIHLGLPTSSSESPALHQVIKSSTFQAPQPSGWCSYLLRSWTPEAEARVFACVLTLKDIKLSKEDFNEISKMMAGEFTGEAIRQRVTKKIKKSYDGVSPKKTPAKKHYDSAFANDDNGDDEVAVKGMSPLPKKLKSEPKGDKDSSDLIDPLDPYAL